MQTLSLKEIDAEQRSNTQRRRSHGTESESAATDGGRSVRRKVEVTKVCYACFVCCFALARILYYM
jgi:hypothetical protein